MSLLNAHGCKCRFFGVVFHVKWQPVVTPTVSLTSTLLAFRDKVHIYNALPDKNEARKMRASHQREHNQVGRKGLENGHDNNPESWERVKESLLIRIYSNYPPKKRYSYSME